MDLDFVYKQLLDGHKACKTTLSLKSYQRERLIGLTSILYLSLQNCSTVTMVKTSIYDVKTKCSRYVYIYIKHVVYIYVKHIYIYIYNLMLFRTVALRAI